jgi:hypothetical protein
MMRWRKSSRSTNTESCVEIAHTLDHVRDSKNITGPALRADVRQLINEVRAGRFAG